MSTGSAGRRVAVIGRFQPFHWGHFEYLCEAACLGTQLIVGITNPTPLQVRLSDFDLARSKSEANPFSYDERRTMIRNTFERVGPRIELEFAPCDLRSSAKLRESIGECDIVAVTIYDQWGEERLSLLCEAGYNVTVLWRRAEKIVSGTEVRRRLSASAPWEHLVPSGATEVIKRHVDRFRPNSLV